LGASSSCIHHTLAEINLGHSVEIDFTPLDGTLPNVEAIAQPVTQQKSSLTVGDIFPVDHIIDVTNNPVYFNDQHSLGTILLLSVYGCSSCAQLYPNINSIADEFNEYQVAAIMIGTQKEIDHIIKEHKIRIPVHRLEMHQMGNYGTFTFPFCYILSNEGIILNKGHVQTVSEVAKLLPQQNQVRRTMIS
jgi:hypothetical protein